MTGKRNTKARAGRVVVPVAVVFALAGALAYWLWPGADQAAAAALRPADPKIVATGAAVYRANCASCHGADLTGQPNWRSPGDDGMMPAPPHDETGHTWHHPDDILFRITKFGVAKAANLDDYESAMPAYEGVLSDEEIIAALSWIKAQWPEDIRRRHDEMNTQYRAR